MSNFYDLLNVSKDASDEEIKKAYRQLSRRYHPDITGDTNGHVYTLLNNAYAVLSDGSKRKEYDRTLDKNNNGYSSYQSNESESENTSPSTPTEKNIGVTPLYYDFTQYDWFNKDWGKIKERSYYHMKQNLMFITYALGFILLMAINAFLSFPINSILGIIHALGSVYVVFLFFKITSPRILNIIIFIAVQGLLGYQVINNESDYNPFLLTILTIAISIIFFFIHKPKVNAYFERQDSHLPKELIKNMVGGDIWGKPERTISYQTNIGYGVDQDLTSRQYTATLLQGLAEIPGTKLFHEVLVDDDYQQRTINHIAINRNKVILINSYMLAGGEYDNYDETSMTRYYHGQHNYLPTSLYPDAVDFDKNLPYQAEIRGYNLIHSNNDVPITIPDEQSGTIRIANIDYFLKNAGEWFSETADGSIDRAVFASIVRKVK